MPKPRLRPAGEQVVVITGASSGIGRATAQMLGEKGATVVLAARNVEALEAAAEEVRQAGGRALVVPADVSDRAQVEFLAGAAIENFGRIDSWVNDAAVSEYALIEEMDDAEIEHILRVNVLGTIYGCRAALRYMKEQNGGGALINVGSALSERSIPLQGIYCASKHAVKGFTEALRLELKHQNAPVSVTLILPSVINTPFYTSAKSKMGVRPRPIRPIYDANVVAEAIVFACEHPRRNLYAGGFGKTLAYMEHISAPLTDLYMLQGGRMFKSQQEEDVPDDGRSNLFSPIPGEGSVSGGYDENSWSVSPYTRYLELYPNRKRIIAAALLAGVAASLWTRWQRNGVSKSGAEG